MSGKFLRPELRRRRCCANTKLRDEITGRRGNPKGQPGQGIFEQIQTNARSIPRRFV